MINDFIRDNIKPSCVKRSDKEQYSKLRQDCTMVRAILLYYMYRAYCVEHYKECDMNMQEFYNVIKLYLYYDKYICTHGIEFYYLVEFKDTDLVNGMLALIKSYHPDTLNDVYETVYAIGSVPNTVRGD